MWIVTRSDWPVLINLARAAHIGYQQVAKFNSRTRVVASAWEQDFVVADCADGDEARAIVDLIADSLASGTPILDLRQVESAQMAGDTGAKPTHSSRR
jgi:hypothetical protein